MTHCPVDVWPVNGVPVVDGTPPVNTELYSVTRFCWNCGCCLVPTPMKKVRFCQIRSFAKYGFEKAPQFAWPAGQVSPPPGCAPGMACVRFRLLAMVTIPAGCGAELFAPFVW